MSHLWPREVHILKNGVTPSHLAKSGRATYPTHLIYTILRTVLTHRHCFLRSFERNISSGFDLKISPNFFSESLCAPRWRPDMAMRTWKTKTGGTQDPATGRKYPARQRCLKRRARLGTAGVGWPLTSRPRLGMTDSTPSARRSEDRHQTAPLSRFPRQRGCSGCGDR